MFLLILFYWDIIILWIRKYLSPSFPFSFPLVLAYVITACTYSCICYCLSYFCCVVKIKLFVSTNLLISLFLCLIFTTMSLTSSFSFTIEIELFFESWGIYLPFSISLIHFDVINFKLIHILRTISDLIYFCHMLLSSTS